MITKENNISIVILITGLVVGAMILFFLAFSGLFATNIVKTIGTTENTYSYSESYTSTSPSYDLPQRLSFMSVKTPINISLNFDGIDDKIDVFTNQIANANYTNVTICAWSKPVGLSTIAAPYITYHTLNTRFYLTYSDGINNYTQMGSGNPISYINSSINSWLFNQTKLVCGVQNRINSTTLSFSLFLDGIFYGVKNITGINVSSHFSVSRSAGSEAFNGTIYELRYYNRTLSNSEILNLNNSGMNNLSFSNQSLIMFHRYKEGTGTNVYDSSGYSNNGTISGAIWRNSGENQTLINNVDYTTDLKTVTVSNNNLYSYIFINGGYNSLSTTMPDLSIKYSQGISNLGSGINSSILILAITLIIGAIVFLIYKVKELNHSYF